MRVRRVLGAAVAAGAVVEWGPALTSVAPARRVALPRLAGLSTRDHIALTYDDGPDPASTPHFLELLERHGVSATFFLLGEFAARYAGLTRELAEAGHELAVHGWDHQCLAWKPPGRLTDELRRSKHTIEDITGVRVQWYRPPYGVLTGRGLRAAHRSGLGTVLWSAWGRDWSRGATPGSVVARVTRAVQPGGTVLLHDTDRTSAPGSWRATLGASEMLLETWAQRSTGIGPLREHWSGLPGPDTPAG